MRNILVLLFVCLISLNAYPGHLRGGEITWQCLESGADNGKLVFKVKLWRGCGAGFATLPASISLTNTLYSTYGGPATIACSRYAFHDISPKCIDPLNEIACGLSVGGSEAYEVNLYESAAVQINGVPAATGSDFYYSTCCRAGTLNGSTSNFYLRAVMFPYTDPTTNQTHSLGSTSTGPTCYDNSAVFAETAPYLGVEDKLNHFTTKSIDIDCDSLSYALSDPRTSATTISAWTNGFSANNPLPGLSQNSGNVPISIDSKTGIASYRVIGAGGLYQMCHKATSYKNGVKVSEVYRDYALVIAPNTINTYSVSNQNPSIFFKKPSDISYATAYSDTFDVGQSVEINILATDLDFNDMLQKQKVSLRLVSDLAVDGTFNPFGCKFANCATLDTSNASWNGSVFESTDSLTASFKWDIDCEHLSQCQSSSNLNKEYLTYTFQVVATDDNCNKPLNIIKSFDITIRDTLVNDSPIREVSYADSSALITWEKLVSPQFISYNLYRMNLSDGIYVLLDSITNLNDTSFVDSLGLDSIGVIYRLIPNRGFSCDNNSNTYRAIILQADTVNFLPEITWNNMYKLGGNGNYGYYILQTDSGSGWVTIDSSASTSFTHSNPGCGTILKYRVTAVDTINDVHYLSNVDSVIQNNGPFSAQFEVCNGDSILLAGSFRKTAGIYTDSSVTALGCKVYTHNDLSINPVYGITNNETEICKGDSIMLAGMYRDSSGTFSELFVTNKGCDSIHYFPLKVMAVDVSVSRISNALTANLKNKVYQWLECPSLTPIPSANLATYIATKNGSYAVVINDGLCLDTSDCQEITGIGLDELNNQLEIRTFPNPANTQLTIQIKNSDIKKGMKVQIFTSTGKLIFQSEIISDVLKVDLSSWSEGIYYYTLSEKSVVVYNSSFVKGK